MYEKDEHGEYKCAARWVDAWAGGGPYIAGSCICEVREYADGATRIHKSKPRYLHQHPEDTFAHSVLIQANRELGAQSLR